MSPLRTEAFHQRPNLKHLFPISYVCLQGSNLVGNPLTPAKHLGRFDQCFSDRLGTIQPGRLEARERPFGLLIQADRYGFSHKQDCITICHTSLSAVAS